VLSDVLGSVQKEKIKILFKERWELVLSVISLIIIFFLLVSFIWGIYLPKKQTLKSYRYIDSDVIGLQLYFSFTGNQPFCTGSAIDCEIAAEVGGSKNLDLVKPYDFEECKFDILISGAHRADLDETQEYYRGHLLLTNFTNTNETQPKNFWTHYSSGKLVFDYPGDRDADIVVYNQTGAYVEIIHLDEVIYIADSTYIMNSRYELVAILIAAMSLIAWLAKESVELYNKKRKDEEKRIKACEGIKKYLLSIYPYDFEREYLNNKNPEPTRTLLFQYPEIFINGSILFENNEEDRHIIDDLKKLYDESGKIMEKWYSIGLQDQSKYISNIHKGTRELDELKKDVLKKVEDKILHPLSKYGEI
jgi:hypothetical protein